jgi:uncharacterized membrane protein
MNLTTLINKGLLTVYSPLFSFVIACTLIANWVATTILVSDIADFIVVVTFLASIGIGWIWWSYRIVKWKIWAFSQVDIEDSYSLYERAIGFGLIWPTGNFFNRTEIWTKEDKENWKQLDTEIQEIFERI